jgi:uncharacterized protein YdaL
VYDNQSIIDFVYVYDTYHNPHELTAPSQKSLRVVLSIFLHELELKTVLVGAGFE